MKGFFKSLFRTSKQNKEPVPSQSGASIKQMSIDEILNFITTGKDKIDIRQGTDLIQRLYLIALFDHNVSNDHREIALELANELTAEIEKALAGNSDALVALREANKSMIELARLHGYGSLSWKIVEDSVSDADIIPYVMRPEHRHLVPSLLETLGVDEVSKIRKELVRQLILSGQYKASNAVLILHGLATEGDKAITALFTEEEISALIAVPNDYNAGRQVLVDLGLLPITSGARPFRQIANIQTVVAFMLKERRDESNSDNRLVGLSEDQRQALLLALTFLRYYLSYDNIKQIYGEEISNSLMDIFTEQTAKETIEQLGITLHALYEMTTDKPRDLIFLDSVMRIGGIEAKSEDDWNRNWPFFKMGAAWLNQERVEFQDYLRFMLRAISNPVPRIKTSADEKVVVFLKEIYRQEGATASIAEEAIYCEDWIGEDG